MGLGGTMPRAGLRVVVGGDATMVVVNGATVVADGLVVVVVVDGAMVVAVVVVDGAMVVVVLVVAVGDGLTTVEVVDIGLIPVEFQAATRNS